MKDRQRRQRQRRRPATTTTSGAATTFVLFCTSFAGVVNVAGALSVMSPPRQHQLQTTALTQPSMAAEEVWSSSSEQASFVRSDDGVDLELPNFSYVFDRIQQVSPLARKVVTSGSDNNSVKIPASSEYEPTSQHPWKMVEASSLARIDKIDHYQGRTSSAPLLRFRSTLDGPCLGECFASFIMDYDQRKQWDAQIDQVYEAHSVTHQLKQVQQHMLESQRHHNKEEDWGLCSRFGVGYCKTKASIVSPREQLTMCGIQDYEDGSCIIWGVEMDQPRHDPLMPRDDNSSNKRLARALSHAFCTTLSPRPAADNVSGRPSFDVEYLLQLEIGGTIPAWISGPVVTENVKQLLKCASAFFAGTDPQQGLESYLLRRARTLLNKEATHDSSSSSHHQQLLRPMDTYMEGRRGLLMTF